MAGKKKVENPEIALEPKKARKPKRDQYEGRYRALKKGGYYLEVMISGVRMYTKVQTKAEGKLWIASLLEEHENGVQLDMGERTVSQFVADWLPRHIKNGKLSPIRV